MSDSLSLVYIRSLHHFANSLKLAAVPVTPLYSLESSESLGVSPTKTEYPTLPAAAAAAEIARS